jgi:signal peptidase II
MNDSSINSTTRFLRLVITVTIVTVLLDQISKVMILRAFIPGDVKPIVPGLFNLTLTYNPGAAFGLWSGLPEGARQLVLALTILVAMGVVVYFLRQPSYRNAPSQAALAAILGGAVGNVIDRFVHGSVVDFLDFYIGNSHWPAFNVADSAICVGVGILLIFPYFHTNSEDEAT